MERLFGQSKLNSYNVLNKENVLNVLLKEQIVDPTETRFPVIMDKLFDANQNQEKNIDLTRKITKCKLYLDQDNTTILIEQLNISLRKLKNFLLLILLEFYIKILMVNL